jgi:SAM-dependent methyltransferase
VSASNDPTGTLAALEGAGIEIGAFHSPLAVGPNARVRYVDRYPPEISRRFFPEIPADAPIVTPDVVAPADELPLPGGSQDFVIASHLIEHIADPIRALKEWRRVLRPGGTLFLRVPDQRGTFDRARSRTSLDHLVLDHREPPGSAARRARDLDHYREWARHVNGLVDPAQADYWARLLERTSYPIHFHCWQPPDLRELLAWIADHEGAAFDVVAEHARDDHYEFTVVGRARG